MVKHLLEYKKYKSVIQQLSHLEDTRLQKENRGNLALEIKKISALVNVDVEIQDLDLYKLMRVFQKVAKRYELQKSNPIHQIIPYPFTIETQKEILIKKLYQSKNQRISFKELLAEQPEKILTIFNFLAVLDLLQLKKIIIYIGEGFNNFWIEPRTVRI